MLVPSGSRSAQSPPPAAGRRIASLVLSAALLAVPARRPAAQSTQIAVGIAQISVDTSGALGAISGTASDPVAVKGVTLQILDAGTGRYWNGSTFTASASPISLPVPIVAGPSVAWMYSGLAGVPVVAPSTLTVTAQAFNAKGNVAYATSTLTTLPISAFTVQPPVSVVGSWLRHSDHNEPNAHPGSGLLAYSEPQAGIAPFLLFTPTHNSIDVRDSRWGFGWIDELDVFLVVSTNGFVMWTDGKGSERMFAKSTQTAGGLPVYVNPAKTTNVLSALAVDASGFPTQARLREKNGTITIFQRLGSTLALLAASRTDRNGNTVTYSRDLDGKPLTATDPYGRTLTMAYTPEGRVASVTDSAGGVTAYAYDASGNKTSVTDANGDVTSYAYDADHRIIRITYPNGSIRTYAYDASGRVLSESNDSGNNQHAYTYFPSSTPITDALGRQIRDEYLGDLPRMLAQRTDPAGGASSYQYDPKMRETAETDPLGRTTRFQYDQNSNITAMTDADNQTTQVSYETTFNQATNITDPRGNKTSLSYDAVGNLTQIQDALNGAAVMGYDGQGHLTSAKDPLNDLMSFAYDGNGELVSATDPLNRTMILTRDAAGRVARSMDPAGHVTELSHDPGGNLIQVKNALNNVTAYNYTPGRPSRLLRSVADANGHTTTFGYDVIGRLTSVANALSQTRSFSYDLKGNLTSATDAKGQTIAFQYDSLDRMTVRSLPEGGVTYQYDPVGNLLNAASYNGSSLQMTYDALNRITQVIQTLPNGFSATIGYAYDANGNRTQMTTPWGNFSYTYDALNQLISITTPQGRVFNLTYDAAGRRTQLAYPNGIAADYAYDAAGQLLKIAHLRAADNVAVASAAYAYDAAGNRTAMTDADGTHVYGYDPLNRLISTSHPPASFVPTKNETFSYDPVGNRLADADITGYSYDAANRLQSNSAFTYGYDVNGNLTRKTDRTTFNSTSYAYNSENRLAQANTPDGTQAAYKYDALGRRIENSTGPAGSPTIRRYIYDNQAILAILDGSNNLLEVFTHGPGIDNPLEMRKADGAEFFLHADGLGSIVAHTDLVGNLVEKIEYQAYGQPTFVDLRNGTAVTSNYSVTGSPYAFTGREFDQETGLFYYRARYYESQIGRFVQEDLASLPNVYAYGADNPINTTDPSGEYIFAIVGAIAGGYTAYLNSGGNIEQTLEGAALGAVIGLFPPFALTPEGLLASGLVYGSLAGAGGAYFGEGRPSPPDIDWGPVLDGAGIGALTGATGGLGAGLAIGAQARAVVAGLFGAGSTAIMDVFHAAANGPPRGGTPYHLFPEKPDACPNPQDH